jgi:hypothetical protein
VDGERGARLVKRRGAGHDGDDRGHREAEDEADSGAAMVEAIPRRR